MSNKAYQYLFLTIALATLAMLSGYSQTGQHAVAYPIDNIIIDGNLNDWPDHINSCEIGGEQGERWGDHPTSTKDIRAYFQIGFNRNEHALYIAVTVFDESIITAHSENGNFDSHDGNEIFIDYHHNKLGSSVVMNGIYGEKYISFGENPTNEKPLYAQKTNGSRRYYEWKIHLGKSIDVGQTIGFDISISDKDQDGSFSWYAWGKETGKQSSFNRLGDVFLLDENIEFGTIKGLVSVEENSIPLPLSVTLESKTNPKLWTQTLVNEGEFKTKVPAGTYLIYPTSTLDVQFDKGSRIEVEVEAEKNIHVDIKEIILVQPPTEFIQETGVLKNDSDLDVDELKNFVSTYMEYFRIPGMSLAIIKDAEIIFAGAFGETLIQSSDSVSMETLFEAASFTKPLFSYTVNRLVDRGLIDLDRPLYQYLPYPDIAYDNRYKLITARIVLSHKTGFPNWRSENEDGKLTIKFTPGSKYGYSGEGFEYLKLVIQKITGKEITQVIQEEVFDNMGIMNAQLTWTTSDDFDRKATPHVNGTPIPKRIWDIPLVAASLHTDAGSYARFFLKFVEGQGLTKKRHKDIFTIHTLQNQDSEDPPVGLGVFIMHSDDGISYGHGGANYGFTGNAVLYKDGKMGYVFMVNSQEASKFDQVLNAYLIKGNK